MLDRVAISAPTLRMVCAALLILLIARVDFFASTLAWQVRGEVAGSALHGPHRGLHPVLRARPQMRTLGMHHRYMMRDDVGRRRLIQLDQ